MAGLKINIPCTFVKSLSRAKTENERQVLVTHSTLGVETLRMPQGPSSIAPEGTYPNRLKELRDLRGKSQGDIGKVVGLSHVHIGRIEKGQSRLLEEYLEPIARALRVQPAELLVKGPERRAYLSAQMGRNMSSHQHSIWLAQGAVLSQLRPGFSEAPPEPPVKPVAQKKQR